MLFKILSSPEAKLLKQIQKIILGSENDLTKYVINQEKTLRNMTNNICDLIDGDTATNQDMQRLRQLINQQYKAVQPLTQR